MSSILDPALRNALRTLKLTGMLDTLDARLAQTRDGTLGHLDFLQVLCEDEIGRRESAALTRRIRRARSPSHRQGQPSAPASRAKPSRVPQPAGPSPDLSIGCTLRAHGSSRFPAAKVDGGILAATSVALWQLQSWLAPKPSTTRPNGLADGHINR